MRVRERAIIFMWAAIPGTYGSNGGEFKELWMHILGCMLFSKGNKKLHSTWDASIDKENIFNNNKVHALL